MATYRDVREMKLRIASDIHSEFFFESDMKKLAVEALPKLDDDEATILILAGDVGSIKYPDRLVRFIDEIAHRFREVLYVPGNHCFYGGNLHHTVDDIRSLISHHDNIFFSDMGTTVIDGVTFHMHTLWTDFDKENPVSMLQAKESMNDYRLIKNGDRVANPQDMLDLHKRHMALLRSKLKKGDIVITHHTPSFQCVPEEFIGDSLNGSFHSDLEEFIIEKKPLMWLSGHTHNAVDKMIGNTRVIINPRGYGNQHKTNGYRPTLVVEV